VLAVAVLAAALATQIPGLARISSRAEDSMLQLFGGRADWSGVAIVDLGAEPLDASRELAGTKETRPRDALAQVNTYLGRIGVRAIVYDIGFFEPTTSDEVFASTLDSSVVLAATGVPTNPSASDRQRRDLVAVALTAATREGELPPHVSWADFRLPVAKFTDAGRAGVGVVNTRPDDDGVTRRIPLLHAAQGVALPSIALATIMASDRTRGQVHASGTRIGLGVRSWSATDDGAVYPKFPRNLEELPILSFERLLAASRGRSDATLEATVRNRAVFIGSLRQIGPGSVRTPVGPLSGVQLNAIGYTQLMGGRVLKPASLWLDAALVLVALLPAVWLVTRRDAPARWQRGVVALFVVALPAVLALVAASAGYPLHWPFALLAGLLSVALALAYHFYQATETRRRHDYEKLAIDDATRLKTEFLNHLTHELRTPLTAIMGFNKVNQLTDDMGREARIANSAVIARNCEHMLTLINNNLDLAKLEAGQLSITQQAEDPEPIFRDVLTTMKALAADRKIELRYVRRTPLPEALVLDAFRLRQVLINLLGNAVKFTTRGSVELAVSWHIAALEIEVRDTGPGIPSEALERIWQPFKQADLTIGRRFGGTGLGLAISRKLVELMGGEISVESQVGLGTTFRMRLPTEAVPRQASSESVAPALVSRGRLSGHVLLADDNEDLRNLVTLLLRNLGLQVKGVEHGLAAVDTAMAEEFDVVLMDMEMPVMNGYEAVHVLRARGYAGTILGLTAHQEGIEVARAILAGCDAVLTKPVSLDSLKQALAPVLEKRAALRSPDVTPRAATQQ
jgi:signal transduction histidine kinase/ActR/RegA family two-component response regulator